MSDMPATLQPVIAHVRAMAAADLAEVTRLHDRVFGPGAYTRTAYRIREGAPGLSTHCLVSHLDGRLIAALRFTEIAIGTTSCGLLLGPLCVAPERAGQGYGRALVATGLERAKAAGVPLVLLVGNMSYYSRFGFTAVPRGQILMPGPVDLGRLLAAELIPGALATARGLVHAAAG
jgi:predicted N-acetyltransferase YhbS